MSLFNTLIPSFGRASTTGYSDGSAAAISSVKIQPVYDIQETPDAYQLTVQLPGVAKDGLEVTAENDELRIVGRRTWALPEGWTPLHRESRDASFELVLTHDNAINTEQIAAELRDGVLNITLPKQEALKPRRIAVA